MSNIKYREIFKFFFIRKGLNAIEISKELDNVYNDDAPSYHTVTKWIVEFKEPERVFEDLSWTGCPSTISTNENIEAIEQIVMRDWQICVRRLAYELPIPTATVYEIMSNHLGMKKVFTKWVRKLLIPVQCVDCCQEFLQKSEVNPNNYFDCIVTGDGIWVYYYDPLSEQEAKIWKKRSEETSTRLRRTRLAEMIMMVIF